VLTHFHLVGSTNFVIPGTHSNGIVLIYFYWFAETLMPLFAQPCSCACTRATGVTARNRRQLFPTILMMAKVSAHMF
jgi:hypothetical protein